MRFAFTDDQLLFRDTVRDILADRCRPSAVRAAWESPTGRVPGLWATLAETGVVGLTAPEAAGGLGMSDLDLVLLLEEAGRAVCPEPLVEHTAVGIPLLRDHAPSVLADRWLAPAAAGAATLAVGLAAAGRYVVGATQADLVIVQHGDHLMAVDAADFACERQRSVDESRRLASVRFDPGAAIMVTDDPGAIAVAFDRGALGVAAQCIGVAQQLVDMTVAYVAAREQFGKPVGVHQAVKHQLANAALGIEFARPLVYMAAWSLSEVAAHASRDVSMAKAAASDAVDRACRAALQCHGAIGYTAEYDLQLWLKRGWALAAAWGDAPWHRDRVGREIGL